MLNRHTIAVGGTRTTGSRSTWARRARRLATASTLVLIALWPATHLGLVGVTRLEVLSPADRYRAWSVAASRGNVQLAVVEGWTTVVVRGREEPELYVTGWTTEVTADPRHLLSFGSLAPEWKLTFLGATIQKIGGARRADYKLTYEIVVPVWHLVVIFALVSFVLWGPEIRARRAEGLRKRGRCPRCGYDIRATPTRCPECGEFTPLTPGNRG